jgi:hypothetical protein
MKKKIKTRFSLFSPRTEPGLTTLLDDYGKLFVIRSSTRIRSSIRRSCSGHSNKLNNFGVLENVVLENGVLENVVLENAVKTKLIIHGVNGI